jgi:hypothetical protein
VEETSYAAPLEHQSPWYMRFARTTIRRLRPHFGWIVLLVLLMLTAMPALAVGVHEWISVRRMQNGLTLVGPLAILTFWLIAGWKRPRWNSVKVNKRWQGHFIAFLRFLGAVLLFSTIGLAVLSQLFLRWLPTLADIRQAAATGGWVDLGQQVSVDFLRLFDRYAIWWTGIQAGGAAQDDLVLAGLVGMVLWSSGLLTAWLARRRMSGLATSLPSLWLTGMLLIYTREGRFLMATALLLAVALQLLLDQRRLLDRWSRRGYDYSGDVMLDRYIMAGALLDTAGPLFGVLAQSVDRSHRCPLL